MPLRHISVFAGNAQGWEKHSRSHHITSQDTDSTGVGGGSGRLLGVEDIHGISGILHQGNGGSGDVAERQSFGSNHLQANSCFALLKEKSEIDKTFIGPKCVVSHIFMK